MAVLRVGDSVVRTQSSWAACLVLGMTALVGAQGPTTQPQPVYVFIQKAGNVDDDRERLAILNQLRTRPGLDESLKADLDQISTQVDRWLNEKSLRYFSHEIKRVKEYDFKIAADSPFFPLTDLYRARMFVWGALEYHASDARRLQASLDKARESLNRYARAFPENRIARMYLGEPILSDKRYPAIPGAPDWAIYQREGLERLTDIIEWWIDNRQQASGAYGGAWGDDCEMWRWWVPVLIGFDSPKIVAAQTRFSEGIFQQPHMKLGYTNRMTDVEHTAEDSADSITPMMLLDPDNNVWSRRALRLAELMETRWTDRNERGFLQFKSTCFTADKVDTNPQYACDTVMHTTAVEPALLYWQRTGDERLTKLFTAWADTWVDASARAERGKPAGIIPSAIHWPDGAIGGVGPEWWDPKNHDETYYRWPGAMGHMLDMLLLTYHLTGEEKYLEPLRPMARLRLDYLKRPPKQDAPVELRRARKLGAVSSVAAKYRFLTGGTEFDELLVMDWLPYVRFRLRGDRDDLVTDLRETAEALRINFPGYTSEVRFTDRVLSFPLLFGEEVKFAKPSMPIRSPNPGVLYATVTGGVGNARFFPNNAVRWLTPPREIAALVTDTGTDRFAAELFHFGEDARPMTAELYLLAPGSYTLTLVAGNDRNQTPLATYEFDVKDRRTRVSFKLPPRKACVLEVHRRAAGNAA